MDRCPIIERADLADLACRYKFDLHHLTVGQSTYWQEGACWIFSRRELERWILPASCSLHDMLMAYVERVCGDPDLLAWVGVPVPWREVLRHEWHRSPSTLLIRLDLAYDGQGPPRLLECEAEAPGSIFETGFFQLQWFEHLERAGALPPGTGPCNLLHDVLVERLAAVVRPGSLLYIAAAAADSEDWLQARYLAACASQAGREVRLLDLDQLGIDSDGTFVDPFGRPIGDLLMLYRWSRLLVERFADPLRAALLRSLRLLAPSWTQLISSKSCLAGLWRMFPGHPLLLPTTLEREGFVEPGLAQVSKPLDGHRGEAIVMCPADGSRVHTSGGSVDRAARRVIQALAPECLEAGLGGAAAAGCRILSTWLVGGRPVAIGMREASDPVLTGSNCRFVPHLVKGWDGQERMRSKSISFSDPPDVFVRWMEAPDRGMRNPMVELTGAVHDRAGFGCSGSRDRSVIVETAQPRPRGPRSSTPA